MVLLGYGAATYGTAFVAALSGFLDPSWAPTMNTLLIIVLALVNAFIARKTYKTQQEARHADLAARDAKRAIGANRRNNASCTDTGERRRWND